MENIVLNHDIKILNYTRKISYYLVICSKFIIVKVTKVPPPCCDSKAGIFFYIKDPLLTSPRGGIKKLPPDLPP